MKKRLISLIVAVVMLFSMLCPAAYADDETVSFDTCVHEWETPIRSGYSIAIPNSDFSFGVNVEQCKKCKWYKHVATIIVAEFTYYSPFNVNENGLIPTELATFWANVWYKTFGKNATAVKAPSGIGRKDLPGFEDEEGTAQVSKEGKLTYVVHGDHKGIFWALVSLILALIAFFTNLFAGVAYLFPFLPEGMVMTINTCLFVVFLFVIIKFIMRSK